MMAIVLGILVLHAASMGCLWALARFSVTLVDEEGRPIAKTGWTERVVPRRSRLRAGHKLR